MSARAALTRTEVLVVIGILALLIGLVVTGIGRVREAAAETHCKNNLKQFALAIHSYYDVNERFPSLVESGMGMGAVKGVPSYFASLIPYLEATPFTYRSERPVENYNAHSSVEFTYGNKDGTKFTSGGGIANKVFRIFIDLSDTTASELRDVPITLPDGTIGYYATCSYAANGLIPSRIGKLVELFPMGNGNTILIAERPQVCVPKFGETVYNLWGVGFYSPHMPAFAALTPADLPGMASTGQVAPVAPWPNENAADRDTTIRVRIGRKDTLPVSTGFSSPIQRIRPGQACDPRLPGTPHRGGMQVAMADGSIRVFGLNTSPWIFWSACSPTGRYDD